MVNKVATRPRVRKGTWRQRRRRAKRETAKKTPLPGSWRLLWQVLCIFRKHWLPLGGIMFVYVLANLVFTSGLGDISHTYNGFKDNLKGSGSHFEQALSGFGSLFGSFGSSHSETGAVLEGALIILISLVIIWALRRLLAGKQVSIKEAFYNSTAQLVPFLIVAGVLIIELIPMALAVAILAAITSPTVEAWGIIIFGSLSIVLALSSVYLITGSMFALYIVTLPEMLPWAALRSANNLVRFRRIGVLRNTIITVVTMALAMALITLPLILFVHILVAPTFFVLGALALFIAHTYAYSLYRSLLA